MYNDLAWLWPLWGSVEEYRPESEAVARHVKEFAKIDVRSLLDICCGGGKNDFTLKRYLKVTGLDASEAMLANARKLNPECKYVIGDMRDFSLDTRFDSILINDGIPYITTSEDLEATFRTAFKHLRPGGVMVTCAEEYKGHFKQNQTKVFTSITDEPLVTFIENNYDPDPGDTTYETTFVYLIREKGKLRIEHDFHLLGLFTLDTWRKALGAAGFEVHERNEVLEGENVKLFICVKPLW